ncbi:MAG: alpha/beta hydrolase [Bacteroidetes bacterium]|nr:alpha/beta hydrolase [Bacteroidota bacterium]MCH8169612.1 alpha/beta hydrolase [Bacteroidota bacterium]
MRSFKFVLTTILFLLVSLTLTAKTKTVTYKSQDGLLITADLYFTHKVNAPFIILFHQAGWSRGEYKETAPILNLLGFNCLAVDLRSGGNINGVINQTHKRAVEQKKGTNYIDTIQDMKASIKYAKKYYAKGNLIIWGSSYSSALVLVVGSKNKKNVDGILSFSPGEYFEKLGKSSTYIAENAKNITQPVFITSAKREHSFWENIFAAIPSKDKTSFLPKSKGNHGSRVLWSKFEYSKEYWEAVKSFLNKYPETK